MEYVQGDEHEKCLECLEEAIEKNIPAIQRMRYIETLPCSKHGHPGILPKRLKAWFDFFGVIAPYSTPQTLDHTLISKICEEYGISFVKAFEMLSVIQKVVAKHGGKGTHHSAKKDAETGESIS